MSQTQPQFHPYGSDCNVLQLEPWLFFWLASSYMGFVIDAILTLSTKITSALVLKQQRKCIFFE